MDQRKLRQLVDLHQREGRARHFDRRVAGEIADERTHERGVADRERHRSIRPNVDDRDARARDERVLFEVPHRVGVELDIFEKAHELDRLAGDEVLQRLQRRIDRRTRPRDRVPVRARRRLTQHGEHPSFDLGGDARLETVRFLVCEVPRHLQDVGEEPLGETVLTHSILGDGEAVRR